MAGEDDAVKVEEPVGPCDLVGVEVPFPRADVSDGLGGLAVMGTMTALAPRGRRAAVLAGMAGAALPDLDKPSRLFFGRSPFPPAVDRFHARIQHEAPRRAHYEATGAVIFAAAALALLRGRERERTTT